MKKTVSILLLSLIVSTLCVGCSGQTTQPEQPSQMTLIGNPWSDWATIEEAEAAAGFSFGLPGVIADRYTAVSFRTMNNELMEVIYRDADSEICVRKQAGEDQDISGDYNQYDTRSESHINGGTVIQHSNTDSNAAKHLISCNGFSWSLVASNGYHADADRAFLSSILEQPLA